MSVLRVLPLAYLQRPCLLNAELEYSRFNLVLKQPRLCNDLIFGVLCCYYCLAAVHHWGTDILGWHLCKIPRLVRLDAEYSITLPLRNVVIGNHSLLDDIDTYPNIKHLLA